MSCWRARFRVAPGAHRQECDDAEASRHLARESVSDDLAGKSPPAAGRGRRFRAPFSYAAEDMETGGGLRLRVALEAIEHLLDGLALVAYGEGKHQEDTGFLRVEVVGNDEPSLILFWGHDNPTAAGARSQDHGYAIGGCTPGRLQEDWWEGATPEAGHDHAG